MNINEVKKHSKRLGKNQLTLLQFEGIFKLLIIVFAVPVVSLLEDLAMRATGYSYLTAENILRFFLHPITMFLLFLVIICLIFLMLMDFSAVVYNLHNAWYDTKTDLFGTMFFSFNQAVKIFRKEHKLLLFFVLLVLLPVFSFGLLPGLLGNLLIREWVLKQIRKNLRFVLAASGFGILLLVMFLRWMYVVQICILEACSFPIAIRRSAKTGKKRHFLDLLLFLAAQLSCYMVYAVFLGIAMLIAFLTEQYLGNTSFLNPISKSVLVTITRVALFLQASVSAPASCLCIAIQYYRHKVEDGESIPGLSAVNGNMPFWSDRHRKIGRTVVQVILLLSLIICSTYLFMQYRGQFNPKIEYLHQMEITAHRGASRSRPENTMAAFKKALDLNADWIELDIHQSLDGVLYVMHDKTLMRTCGMRGYGWDYTWEELSGMDAGARFNREYSGERIPRLSDVLDFAKENHIRLNIEMKPSKYEKGMEERLVELLHEKDLVADCVVTSQKYSAIEKVKELDEKITTVYVMSYAFGNIERLSAADAFSINLGSVSARLVRRLHNAGRQVYAWTVNSRVDIENMIEKGVDNIITDDVSMATKIVTEYQTGSALHEYIRWLRSWLR